MTSPVKCFFVRFVVQVRIFSFETDLKSSKRVVVLAVFCVDVTQAGVITEKGALGKEMPP